MCRIAFFLLLSGCFSPVYEPAYVGEPVCGDAETIHATEGEPCSGPVEVACDCSDRFTLECRDGVWVYWHWVCYSGLGAGP